MGLTNNQKKAIHIAAKDAGIDSKTQEDVYRSVLQNVGGFYSAADRSASRQGFIAVMAWFERKAGGKLSRSGPGYWQAEDCKANPRDALVFQIFGLAKRVGMTPSQLDAFIASDKMSGGMYHSVNDAPVAWLPKIKAALYAINRRQQQNKFTNSRINESTDFTNARRQENEPATTTTAAAADEVNVEDIPF